MNVKIKPGTITGTIDAIVSKSHLHRLLICAALADELTPIYSDATKALDIKATIDCLEALGAEITWQAGIFWVVPINKESLPNDCILPCNESGSTLRFLLPVVAALGVTATFVMAGRLPQRPLVPLSDELMRNGVTLTRPTATTLRIEGRLRVGNYVLPGNISSQYISGLLMALPLLPDNSALIVTDKIESAAYITMTTDVQNDFGIVHADDNQQYLITGRGKYQSPSNLVVDGDWSNGAFWLACGAMPDCALTLTKINQASLQGDRQIIDILAEIGAKITWSKNSVTVTAHQRHAVEIDATEIPDLIPVIAAVLAVATGTSRITNAQRLRLKESDRLATTAATLNALGAKVTELEDGLVIEGGASLTGGTVDAFGDHRIAMCAAVAALACSEPVVITGAEAVNKSYPQLWSDFSKLGMKLEIKGVG